MKQPQSRVACQLHTEHRLPLNKSVQFHVSTNCVLSNNLCALVTHLIEGSIHFEETRLVNKEGLLPLRGCRPTSDQKHLTNFSIQGCLYVIVKQSTLQGKKVEDLGWERFESGREKTSSRKSERQCTPDAPRNCLVPCHRRGTQHWFLLTVISKIMIFLCLIAWREDLSSQQPQGPSTRCRCFWQSWTAT